MSPRFSGSALHMPPRSVIFAKRLLDVAASSVGLALTAPLFPLIAVAIKADSPGPVIYLSLIHI